MKAKKSIGIIGFGNMGSAIATRLKGYYRILVFDQDFRKTKALQGLKRAASVENLLLAADLIIIAVKPEDFPGLLRKIKGNLGRKLLISIAAGISTQYIQRLLGPVRVVRVMPNMPAKIGKGMSCLSRGRFAKAADLNRVEKIFKHLGHSLVLNERMIDAATAISGSGPGYFYDFIASKSLASNNIPKALARSFRTDLSKAAESIGFSKKEAGLLATVTIRGSLAALEASDLTPSELRKQVTSKGGTTEAGLRILHQGGSLNAAVEAAFKKAKQLSHDANKS